MVYLCLIIGYKALARETAPLVTINIFMLDTSE
jgi:hypothetical protein